MQDHAPPPEQYLIAHVGEESGHLVLELDNNWPGKQTFSVRLFAVKVENQTTSETVEITVETFSNDPDGSTPELISRVVAEVEPGGGTVPYEYCNGAWIFVTRRTQWIRISAVSVSGNLVAPDPSSITVRASIQADTVAIGTDGGQWAKSHDQGVDRDYVHIQDGSVRIANSSEGDHASTYYVWTADGQDNWSYLGRSVESGDTVELPVDGFSAFRLSTSQTAVESSRKIFQVFDCNGDTVYLFPDQIADDQGTITNVIRSCPYAITPPANSNVVKVAYSNPGGGDPSSVSVWREGEPKNTSAVHRSGPPVPFTVPHSIVDHDNEQMNFQASLHWATGGDPKVIVRQDNFATRPVKRDP